MEIRRQTSSIGVIEQTRNHRTKSEELQVPYVTAITWENESGPDLGEMMCDDRKWTEVTEV
jgi:hypothetical protein